MTISESQLETWAAPPGDAKAVEAHRQIREALENDPVLSKKTVDIYLQGSYRNRTHIRADSDVDVVAELSSTFSYDVDQLVPAQKALFETVYPGAATYRFDDFKADVARALKHRFGEANVDDTGNKCLKVAGSSSRSPADVLACLEHRKYTSFTGYTEAEQPYIPGIRFYTRRERMRIINWPKVHYSFGAEKNDETDEKFKHLVRIFKHLRRLLVESDIIPETRAPSYFLECLLYNVPNSYFDTTYSGSLRGALGYLQTANLSTFSCVNRLDALFGGPSGWSVEDARLFIQLVEAVNQPA